MPAGPAAARARLGVVARPSAIGSARARTRALGPGRLPHPRHATAAATAQEVADLVRPRPAARPDPGHRRPGRAGRGLLGPRGQRLGQRRPARRAAAARRAGGSAARRAPSPSPARAVGRRAAAGQRRLGAGRRLPARRRRGGASSTTTCRTASGCWDRQLLLAPYPLLLLVLALIAWRVIGAALRPVEQLRVAAERISGGRPDVRLPVPTAPRRGARPRRHPQRDARPAGGRPGTGSAPSSPTPPTSCAARWPRCSPSSRSPTGSARAPSHARPLRRGRAAQHPGRGPAAARAVGGHPLGHDVRSGATGRDTPDRRRPVCRGPGPGSPRPRVRRGHRRLERRRGDGCCRPHSCPRQPPRQRGPPCRLKG